MKKLNLIYVFLLMLITSTAFSQNWPEDPATRKQVEEQWVLLTDGVNAKNWKQAAAAYDIIHEKAPDLIKSLYIKGAQAYEGLEDKEKDKAKKLEYAKKALEVYDERIKYFGEEENVLNRKGLKAFNYLINVPEERQNLIDLYEKIYELNGNDIYTTNIYSLMILYIKEYAANRMEKADVMDKYVMFSDLLEARIAEEGKDSDRQYKKLIDDRFAKDVPFTCDDINSILVPKFEEDKTNVKNAKKLVGMMGSVGCEKTDLYYEAVELVLKEEPSCGAAMAAGKRSKKDGDLSWSIKFFNSAAELCPDEMLAEVNYELATIYKMKGQKETARSYCQKAFTYGGSFAAAAHNLLGEIYYSSAKDCDPQDVIVFRSRYIAAYEEFKAGGSEAGMAKSKAQFPSNDELFEANKEVGQSFNTECWMNVTVTLQKR